MKCINFTADQHDQFLRILNGQKNYVVVDVPEGHQASEAAVFGLVQLCPHKGLPIIRRVSGWSHPAMPGRHCVVLFLTSKGTPARVVLGQDGDSAHG